MRCVSLAIVVVFAAGHAHADVARLVFPLASSRLPPAFAKAPDAITRALATAIEADVANVPIEDAAGLLDCDPEASTCLVALAKSLKARRIVFGAVEGGIDGEFTISLTRFDPGLDRQQRTFAIKADSVDELAAELVKAAKPLFRKFTARKVDEPTNPVTEPVTEPVDRPRTSIPASTWGIIGGGGLVAVIGAGYLISASAVASEVRGARRDTPQDFAFLTTLEETGASRMRIGTVLTVLGTAVLGFGIYRALTHHDAPPREPGAVQITPIPIEGGAALVLTMGLP